MYRPRLNTLLIVSAVATLTTINSSVAEDSEEDWIQYAEEANGDLYFYNRSLVEKTDTLRRVWNGIRYKTSLMGAFSFSSLVEIDCVEGTEKTLQSTFFSDKNWEKAAMATDTKEKPSKQIAKDTPMEQLKEIMCDG